MKKYNLVILTNSQVLSLPLVAYHHNNAIRIGNTIAKGRGLKAKGHVIHDTTQG